MKRDTRYNKNDNEWEKVLNKLDADEEAEADANAEGSADADEDEDERKGEINEAKSHRIENSGSV